MIKANRVKKEQLKRRYINHWRKVSKAYQEWKESREAYIEEITDEPFRYHQYKSKLAAWEKSHEEPNDYKETWTKRELLKQIQGLKTINNEPKTKKTESKKKSKRELLKKRLQELDEE